MPTLAAGATLLLVSTGEIYGKNTTDRPERRLRPHSRLGAGKSRWTYAAAKSIDEAFALGRRPRDDKDVVLL